MNEFDDTYLSFFTALADDEVRCPAQKSIFITLSDEDPACRREYVVQVKTKNALKTRLKRAPAPPNLKLGIARALDLDERCVCRDDDCDEKQDAAG
jgi:hypothetical protein